MQDEKEKKEENRGAGILGIIILTLYMMHLITSVMHTEMPALGIKYLENTIGFVEF